VIGALASPAPRSDGGKADLIRRLARMQQVVPTGYCKILLTVLVSAATIAAVLVIGLSPRRAVSLPLYARQTGQPCATCHTAFLELTPFGRRFKLGGYTLGGGDWTGPPFAVMLQQRDKPQPTKTVWAIGSMEWLAEQEEAG